ncbi:MAG: TylF/MycF/NovP-related O-methyltransferase [Candidatus Omnitrophota bacterium]
MGEFDGFKKTGIDSDVEKDLEKHFRRFNIGPLDALKLFPVLARRQWLKRFLAHVELFQKTLDVPGDIAELGVFRGLGLMTWANLLEAYCIGDRTKIVYGFDNWKGFTELDPEDGKDSTSVQKFVGGFSPEKYYNEIKQAIAIFDKDRFIPWKPRVKLVKGDVVKTVPKFIKENPGTRFSLIHFDCDLYRPTKIALEVLWPVLSRGGVMLFDEYSISEWPGETRAVDDFFNNKANVRIKALSWTNAPAGYVIKGSD